MTRVGVLASGAGTNLGALLDRVHGRDGVEVVAVGSDQVDAPALERARAVPGIATATFPRDAFPDRAARDAATAAWLRDEHGVELLVLAGYMQLVSDALLAFPLGTINVHPSLLPAFPGLDAIGQALANGSKVTGVTVHYVDSGIDSGRIIAQRALDIATLVTPDAVHAELRPLEHELLCDAVAGIAAGRIAPDPSHPRRVLTD